MRFELTYNAGVGKGRIFVIALGMLAGLSCRQNATPYVAAEVPEAELLRLVPPDLAYAPREIDSERNRWIALQQALASRPVVTNEERIALDQITAYPSLGTEPRVARGFASMLAKYQASFEGARKAVSRPETLIGELKGGELPMRTMGPIRQMVSLAAKKGTFELTKGNVEAAIDDYDLALRLGQTVAVSEAPLEYAVMAGSLLSRAYREIREAAWHPKMTAAGINRMLAILPEAETLHRAFKTTIRSDLYWFIRNEVMRLKGPGANSASGREAAAVSRDFDSGWLQADEMAHALLKDHPEPFDRKDTVEKATALYQEMLANLDRKWTEQTRIGESMGSLVAHWPVLSLSGADPAHPAVRAEVQKALPELLKATNPYGRFAVWYFVQLSRQSVLIPFRNRSDLEATRLALHLRKYELKRGRLPSSLEELPSETGLTALPNDPFSAKGYRYDPARKRLWSVGQNGTDEGGKEASSLSANAKDYVYALEYLSPAPSTIPPPPGFIVVPDKNGAPIAGAPLPSSNSR